MYKTTITICIIILFSSLLRAKELTPKINGKMSASISLDLRNPIEPVNRRVLGLCLMHPPFNQKVIDAVKPILEDSSVRVWLHKWTDNNYMQNVMNLIKQCQVSEVLSMSPMCKMNNVIAQYNSETDNNLQLTHQTPLYQQNMINSLNNLKHKNFPEGYGVTGYEIWNEPQYPQNGAWGADDYARYTLDVSKRIKKVDPTMDIGVCLRPSHKWPNWNRDMLIDIAKENPKAINFVIHHPYDFFWISSKSKIGTYYAQVAGSELHYHQLESDMKLLQQIGHGRWRMALTEWNTHPQGYAPPTNVSRDLPVAINIAGAIQMYWELGIDSAHYFLLHGKVKNGMIPHFAIIAEKENGELIFNPTYYVLKMYGERSHGIRIKTDCISPTYIYPNKDKEHTISIIKVASIYDFKKEELNLLIINRHRDKPIKTAIQIKNFRPTENYATLNIITGKKTEAETAEIKSNIKIPLTMKNNSPLVIDIEPHSINSITIKGIRPLTERERASKYLCFIKKWYICGIFNTKESLYHGLNKSLPCSEENRYQINKKYRGFENSEASWTKIQSDISGYIDFFDPHRILGLDKKVRENLQGVAVSYIWSSDKREVTFSFGADYWAIVKLNDKVIIDQRENVKGQPAADKIRCRGFLKKGWNKILVRIASGSHGMGFWLAVENKGDLYFESSLTQPTELPQKVIYFPTQSTYINNWNEFTDKQNHQSKTLEISANKATERRALIQWDLNKDLNCNHSKINTIITLKKSFEKSPGSIILGRINSPWKSDTTTAKNHPKFDTTVLSKAVEKDNYWIFQGNEINNLVEKWLKHPSMNYGIWISSTDSRGYAGISNNKHDLPKLEVYLTNSKEKQKCK